LHLKLARVSADLTDAGRLFHTVGLATEKALYIIRGKDGEQIEE